MTRIMSKIEVLQLIPSDSTEETDFHPYLKQSRNEDGNRAVCKS